MTDMSVLEKIYKDKRCFISYNDRFVYNGIILSISDGVLVIDDDKIGAVSLPIDKCKIELREVRK